MSTMGRSSVMLFVAISTITITQVWGACVDYTCAYNAPDGVSKTSMTVDAGDKCGYFTQAGDTYPGPRGKQRQYLIKREAIRVQKILIIITLFSGGEGGGLEVKKDTKSTTNAKKFFPFLREHRG